MRYIINNSTDPHFNMAFDEWSLERLDMDEPVFFVWQNAPAVIIGLNQNAYSEVNLQYLNEHGIKLARRVTGGGAVYHDLQNLNYTIVGRSRDLEADYPRYTEMVADALRTLGAPAEVSGRNDILVEGRKVSGYAKRVWRDRLMVHGTLMYDVDLTTLGKVLDVKGSKVETKGVGSVRSRVANLKDYLPGISSVGGLQQELTRLLAAGDDAIIPSQADLDYINNLADTKFRTWEWIMGQSPRADIERSKRLPCGTVIASICVDHGIICSISFGGDFIGSLPSKAVEDILTGCRYDREAILGRLSAIPVAEYFEKTTPEELSGVVI